MRAVPIHVVEAMITEIRGKMAVLQTISDSDELLRRERDKVTLLETLIERAQASANDELSLEEAIDWSGLGDSALRSDYASTGSHRTRRWRRADLPVRNLFSDNRRTQMTDRQKAEVAAQSACRGVVVAPRDEELDEEDILRRALEESRAA
jgi:hypothetical protein